MLAPAVLTVAVLVPLAGCWRYGRHPNRKHYEIKLLQNGSLKWEGPHSRGWATRNCPDRIHSYPALFAGGMLSGVLEEDEDGWYFAQLITGQNEPIGLGAQLMSSILSNLKRT